MTFWNKRRIKSLILSLMGFGSVGFFYANLNLMGWLLIAIAIGLLIKDRKELFNYEFRGKN